MKATHLLHQACGGLALEGVRRLEEPALCAICGERTGDVDVRDVTGNAFTQYDLLRARDSPGACEACAWAKAQKEFRWSHWVVSPAGLRKFKWFEAEEVLFNPPEPPFAIYCTTSMKKIGALFTPVNHSREGFTVQMEMTPVAFNPARAEPVLETIKVLRGHKFTEAEMISGHYKQAKMMQAGPLVVMEAEEVLVPERSSGLVELLVYATRIKKEKK